MEKKHYNPENTISQHIAIKGNVGNVEVNRVKNSNIRDTLTSVDFQETVTVVEKCNEVSEGISCRENS